MDESCFISRYNPATCGKDSFYSFVNRIASWVASSSVVDEEFRGNTSHFAESGRAGREAPDLDGFVIVSVVFIKRVDVMVPIRTC